MSAIEKVLLRKDVSSVIVAIIIGIAVVSFLGAITAPLASSLVDNGSDLIGPDGFSTQYLLPTLAFALQVIALELLLRIIIVARHFTYGKSPAKRKK